MKFNCDQLLSSSSQKITKASHPVAFTESYLTKIILLVSYMYSGAVVDRCYQDLNYNSTF